ncbi:MAG: hypothetical protein OXH97_11055, partial [Chloroflexota bacterium]|nr:hypothetical protein [Chloroflexota bacterium]
LTDAGFTIEFKGQLDSILLDHVRTKVLDGTSLGLSDHQALSTTRRMLKHVEDEISRRKGLVSGMVKHGIQ